MIMIIAMIMNVTGFSFGIFDVITFSEQRNVGWIIVSVFLVLINAGLFRLNLAIYNYRKGRE